MKDELGGKIMAEFAASKPKACSYLKNDFNKAKVQTNVSENGNLNLKIKKCNSSWKWNKPLRN